MSPHQIHRADLGALVALIAAYFAKWSLQDVATIVSIFAFLATGIYYSVAAWKAWKYNRKETD